MTDTRGRTYRIAKWTDERGANTLVGFTVPDAPRFTIEALFHPEFVVIPDGAELFEAHRPEMRLVGRVVNGQEEVAR